MDGNVLHYPTQIIGTLPLICPLSVNQTVIVEQQVEGSKSLWSLGSWPLGPANSVGQFGEWVKSCLIMNLSSHTTPCYKLTLKDVC